MPPVSRGDVPRHTFVSLTLTLVAGFAAAAAAQNPSSVVPTYLSIVSGDVTLDRDGLIENAVENTPLLSGDRLSTARGRLEVRLGRDAILSVDESSSLRLVDAAFVALDAGTVHLNVRGHREIRMDGAGASIVTTNGEFRVRVFDNGDAPELRVAGLRGSAEVFSEVGRTILRAGYEIASPADGSSGRPYAVSVSRLDAFDRWVDSNRRDRTSSSSASHLPSDLREYAAELSRSGDWGYVAPYGYVWYPRVAVGWRPYSDGQWTFVGSFGWTWAAGPRWGWPTHHYGRWGWGGTNWYWIPGTQWAPAWVSWGSANGYLGWCPLGFDNRPAVPVTSVGAWNGWTTVPSTAFSQSVVVGRHGVRPVEAQWRRSATIRTAGPARPIGRSRPPAPLASRGTSIAVAAPTTRVPSTERAAGSVSVRRAPQTSVSAEPAARFGSAARPATSRWIARAEATAAASEASPVSRASRSSSPSRGETAPPGVSRSETRARALPSPVRVSPGSTALATSPARRALLPTTAAARSRPATRTPSTRASTSASTRTHSVTAPAVPPILTLAPASIFIRAAAPR